MVSIFIQTGVWVLREKVMDTCFIDTKTKEGKEKEGYKNNEEQ